ncbi:hypothetical protein [Providencia huaxiensis]|uniref:hypothetical protein n=1 Tax=Providencia huaxiensis TaxID=2027290 RepID=UPI000C7ECF23|nr:hypothetical protein [Providencia huaxiensis]AXH60538.1 hypothetical protein CYG50_00105 [Providencia huaxiensis]
MNEITPIKKAQKILRESELRILIVGDEDSNKKQLIKSSHIENMKYFDFKEILQPEMGGLAESNIDLYYEDIINSKEKVIVLDSVTFSTNSYDSKLCNLIKTARKNGKKLIILTENIPDDRLKNLFGFVIKISDDNFDRQCIIEEVF